MESSKYQLAERHSRLVRKRADEIARRYGELLGGLTLVRALGYHSAAALRTALSRGTLTLNVFSIAGRRGRFATALTVAEYLVKTEVGNTGGASTALTTKEGDG